MRRKKIIQLHEKHNVIVRKLENMINEKQKKFNYEQCNSLSALSSSLISSSWLRSRTIEDLAPYHHLSTSSLGLNRLHQQIHLQNSQDIITSSINNDNAHQAYFNPSFEQKIHNITMQVFNLCPASLSSFYNMDVQQRKCSSLQSNPYISSFQTHFTFDDNFRTENQNVSQKLLFQHRLFSTRPATEVDRNLPISPPLTAPKNQSPSSLDTTKHQSNDLSTVNINTNITNTSSSTSNKSATSTISGSVPSSNYSKKIQAAIQSVTKAIINFIIATPGVLWFYLTHPKDFQKKMKDLMEHAKKEAHHYYMGSKVS